MIYNSKKIKLALTSILAGSFGMASATTTLLVDFSGNDNGGSQTSTSSDFVGDPNIDLTAIVNDINGDVAAVAGGTPQAVTGVGVAADVSVTSLTGGFATTGGVFPGNPLLSDYIFGNTIDPTVVVTGLEEFAGLDVTLTVYSHGDQAAQIANIIVDLDNDATDDFTSGVTSEGTPFVTYTFTAASDFDTLSFRADNTGEGNQFAAINGFSITAVPEPSSALLLLGGAAGFVLRRRRN